MRDSRILYRYAVYCVHETCTRYLMLLLRKLLDPLSLHFLLTIKLLMFLTEMFVRGTWLFFGSFATSVLLICKFSCSQRGHMQTRVSKQSKTSVCMANINRPTWITISFSLIPKLALQNYNSLTRTRASRFTQTFFNSPLTGLRKQTSGHWATVLRGSCLKQI